MFNFLLIEVYSKRVLIALTHIIKRPILITGSRHIISSRWWRIWPYFAERNTLAEKFSKSGCVYTTRFWVSKYMQKIKNVVVLSPEPSCPEAPGVAVCCCHNPQQMSHLRSSHWHDLEAKRGRPEVWPQVAPEKCQSSFLFSKHFFSGQKRGPFSQGNAWRTVDGVQKNDNVYPPMHSCYK